MEIEKLSVSEFLRRLKIVQLWAVGVTVASLLAGTFGLGYKAAMTVNEAKLNAKDAEITDVKRDLETMKTELKAAHTKLDEATDKDRFLSLYLRYLLAKETADSDPENEEKYRTYETTLKAFDNYIREQVDKEKLIIRKGGGRFAMIEFKDETKWQIPPELHMVEAE